MTPATTMGVAWKAAATPLSKVQRGASRATLSRSICVSGEKRC